MLASCLVIAYVTVKLLGFASSFISRRWQDMLSLSLLVGIFGFGISSNYTLSVTREGVSLYWRSVQDLSNWMVSSLPQNTTILTTYKSRNELFVASQGKLKLTPLFSENAADWASISLDDGKASLFSNTLGQPGEFPAVVKLADPDPGRKIITLFFIPVCCRIL